MKTTRLLPVLEPLCEATSTQLRPINLWPQDHLEIKLDDEGTWFLVRAISRNPDGSECQFSPSLAAKSGWLKKVPETKECVDDPEWTALAGTDFTALIIYHNWPEERLVFVDEDAKSFYHFLLLRFLGQTNSSIINANFKVLKQVPEMPEDFVDHPDLPLTDYQKVGLAAALEKESYACFMQQGTGKTPMNIARMCTEARRCRKGLYGKPRMYRVLIVAPRQVRTNWVSEIKRFATCQGKTVIVKGDPIQRVKCVVDGIKQDDNCYFGAVIASYESICRSLAAFVRVPWDLMIVDESHYIKTKQTKRFKALHALRSMNWPNCCNRRTILTGTPIANSILDLWTQLEFLGEGLSGFIKWQNFKEFYGKFKKIGDGIEKLIETKNLPLIRERLARIAFMITKAEANLGLPDKVYDIYEAQMTPKQYELYCKVRDDLAAEIEDKLNDTEKKITVEHILTMLLRLAQITSGHIKWDDIVDEDLNVIKAGAVEQIEGGNPKIDATIEMFKEGFEKDPKGKKIVWAIFRQDIKVLSQRMTEEGIGHRVYFGGVNDADRDEAVNSFNNDPNVRVFIANPASAGEGLNLLGYDRTSPDRVDTYVDHEVFFSQGWSSTQRSQAEDRAHRKGTRCPSLRITDLVIPGTIDEEIRARVLAKQKSAAVIQDVREMLRNILNSNPQIGEE